MSYSEKQIQEYLRKYKRYLKETVRDYVTLNVDFCRVDFDGLVSRARSKVFDIDVNATNMRISSNDCGVTVGFDRLESDLEFIAKHHEKKKQKEKKISKEKREYERLKKKFEKST